MSSAGERPLLVARDGVTAEAVVAWQSSDQTWEVRVKGPFGEVVGRGADAFAALEAVRHDLEPAGWRLGVAGARLDAWPSGMAREMGSRLRVYRLTRGRRPSPTDLIDTFEPADLKLVGDVAQQREAVRQWSESLSP